MLEIGSHDEEVKKAQDLQNSVWVLKQCPGCRMIPRPILSVSCL